MTLVRGRRRFYRERPSATPFVAPSVAPLDSSQPPKSGDKLFNQPAGPSRTKPPVTDALIVTTNVPKYSEDNLQRIFKAVLEAQAPVSAPAPAPTPALILIISKALQEKLKARSPDVYCGKSHMDCHNFYQQCENYFATVGATGPTRIPFAASFLWDRISFRWQ